MFIKNEVIKIKFSAKSYCHTEKLYDKFKMLKMRNIYFYLVSQFVFRFCNQILQRLFDG